jgi:NAD(P)H-hydrate epimerase
VTTVDDTIFETGDGDAVTAVTAEEMRAVDRVAVEEFGVDLLQMMENAGRTLALAARERRASEPVAVVAGDGGNGGGGLACARHLANHSIPVAVALDREPDGRRYLPLLSPGLRRRPRRVAGCRRPLSGREFGVTR